VVDLSIDLIHELIVCCIYNHFYFTQAPVPEKEETFEFPIPYLYELENRVFTESWSIPYKREESLGRCLIAATKLAQEGQQFCYG